jgi:hypothetical protein
LRDPPLDATGRDGDDLGGEGVGRRLGEQLAEGLDEAVGTVGAMDVQHGGSFPGDQGGPSRGSPVAR